MPYKGIPANYCCTESRGALFARLGYQRGRIMVQKGARNRFKNSGLPMCCFFCGYDRHVDVAHKRAVMAFPETALVDEINDLRNLIPLCPNHHREADAGEVDLTTVETLGERFGYFGFIPRPAAAGNRRHRHQRGSVSLKPRKKGPDRWAFRFVSNGRERSIILGTIEQYPTKASAEVAAEMIRVAHVKEFSRVTLRPRTGSVPAQKF